MKIVIDIPEEMRTALEQGSFGAKYNIYDLAGCVMNGTPLPKGHGRLIDGDAFKQNICTYQQTGCGSCKHQLCCSEDATTIIEADGGGE